MTTCQIFNKSFLNIDQQWFFSTPKVLIRQVRKTRFQRFAGCQLNSKVSEMPCLKEQSQELKRRAPNGLLYTPAHISTHTCVYTSHTERHIHIHTHTNLVHFLPYTYMRNKEERVVRMKIFFMLFHEVDKHL